MGEVRIPASLKGMDLGEQQGLGQDKLLTNNSASLGMNWQGVPWPLSGAAEASTGISTLRFLRQSFFSPPQPVTKQMEKTKGSRHTRSPAFCYLEGIPSTHQGIRRPRRVQEDLLMQKPTRGSVKASQARPRNRMIEA